MSHLGDAYRDQKKFAQAEALLTEAAEAQGHAVGPEHPDTLLTLDSLAQVHHDEGKYAQAEALFLKVLEIQRRVLRAGHPDTLNTMADLARNYLDEGKYAEAEPLLREALTTYETQLPENWERYRCQSLLGASLAGQKKYAEAEPALLAGYRGMRQRSATIPAPELSNLDFAKQSLTRLYQAWRKPGKIHSE
jgi:tetratricopeptide (TPR) repeat protein